MLWQVWPLEASSQELNSEVLLEHVVEVERVGEFADVLAPAEVLVPVDAFVLEDGHGQGGVAVPD